MTPLPRSFYGTIRAETLDLVGSEAKLSQQLIRVLT